MAHYGQLDKGGCDYWYHPLRVMLRLGPKATFIEQCATLFHDVLEDTPVTAQDMLDAGVPEIAVFVVDKFLTRREGTIYNDYMMNIVEGGNVIAVRAKFADLADNMSPARSDSLPEHLRGVKHRYIKSRELLLTNFPPEVFHGILEGNLPDEMLEPYLGREMTTEEETTQIQVN